MSKKTWAQSIMESIIGREQWAQKWKDYHMKKIIKKEKKKNEVPIQ